jgi:hypothetical protein
MTARWIAFGTSVTAFASSPLAREILHPMTVYFLN